MKYRIIAVSYFPSYFRLLRFRIEIVPRIPRKPQAKYRSRSPGSTVNIKLIYRSIIERERERERGRRRWNSFQSFLGTRLSVSVLVSWQSTRREQTAASECKVRTMPLIFGRPPLFSGHIHLSTGKPTSDTFCSRRIRAIEPGHLTLADPRFLPRNTLIYFGNIKNFARASAHKKKTRYSQASRETLQISTDDRGQ